jgi:hypothetical protein
MAYGFVCYDCAGCGNSLISSYNSSGSRKPATEIMTRLSDLCQLGTFGGWFYEATKTLVLGKKILLVRAV